MNCVKSTDLYTVTAFITFPRVYDVNGITLNDGSLRAFWNT